MQKIRNIQKFPCKTFLTLHWYQAAIAHLLLFKHFKQKHNNCQGILLKSTTVSILNNVKQQLSRFFSAKIQQLQISQSSQFYQTLLQDIQQQTQRLKDTRDCPYINLVYSDKLRNSCMAMRKFGYLKPYQHWEAYQRERKGFCYLIVRPEHRWKEIAANVMAIVKKRQQTHDLDNNQSVWKLDISYEKFIWLYLRPEFSSYSKSLEVKQNKNQSSLSLLIQKQLSQQSSIQKQLSSLKCKYFQKKPFLKNQSKKALIILSSLQTQKITELIFHQFGLPKLVRELRRKCVGFMAVGTELELLTTDQQEDLAVCRLIENREDLFRITWKDVEHVFKLGKKSNIVNWEGTNRVSTRLSLPLSTNSQRVLVTRLPCLPKYFSFFYHDGYLQLVRKYFPLKLKSYLCQKSPSLLLQLQLFSSLIQIVSILHTKQITIGSKFSQCIFVQQQRIVIEPRQNGSIVEDNSKLVLMLREWVKEMQHGEVREDLEKLHEPKHILTAINAYIDDWTA